MTIGVLVRLQYLWRKHPLTTTYYHPPRSTSTPHTLTDCHHSQFSKALIFSLFLFRAATTKSDFRRIAEASLIPPWIPHLALYVIKPLYVLSVTRYRVYSAGYDPRQFHQRTGQQGKRRWTTTTSGPTTTTMARWWLETTAWKGTTDHVLQVRTEQPRDLLESPENTASRLVILVQREEDRHNDNDNTRFRL